MTIINQIITLKTEKGITIHNLTPIVDRVLAETSIKNGQIIVFSQHTTTAIAINEYEERLLEDIKVHLQKLAPESGKYLHNDLHLRSNIPADEPINAHSHLMAMMLNNHEIIPIIDGKLALGTWQSLLFFDLDGPRERNVLIQISGD
jgi:secondary thiamine-phosphate synthase enzyme